MRLIFGNMETSEIIEFRSSHEVLLNEDAILNKNIFDLMSHQAVDDLRTAFENAQTTKRFKFEQEILHRHYNLKIELTPIYLPVQGFAGCSLVIKDITAQKQLEDTIAELDAYAHTVAHDLKNPLGVICGYADFIELKFGSDLAPNVQKRLQKISQTSRKMAEIVDVLLLLASVRNQADVELTALNMGKIIQSALERFGNSLAQAKAQIIMPDNWLTVCGYAPWVEEIWVNYISNALKYGGTPPVLEFGFDEQDSEVRFWLKDNGNGISDAELANLFTEFTRLGRHTSSEGHGLGLSIVQRIAHKLGGSVGAESTAEEGSLFYFTLPYAP
jgi:two-component system, sensor histidine kinase and response regulator